MSTRVAIGVVGALLLAAVFAVLGWFQRAPFWAAWTGGDLGAWQLYFAFILGSAGIFMVARSAYPGRHIGTGHPSPWPAYFVVASIGAGASLLGLVINRLLGRAENAEIVLWACAAWYVTYPFLIWRFASKKIEAVSLDEIQRTILEGGTAWRASPHSDAVDFRAVGRFLKVRHPKYLHIEQAGDGVQVSGPYLQVMFLAAKLRRKREIENQTPRPRFRTFKSAFK